jgi:signal transduction histidine kinase
MVLFTVVSAFIVALGESNRRARAMLETRIRERTAELSIANQSLRAITARILHLQDDERRRLARELHDSVGQLLAAISMNLDSMRDEPLPSPERTKILDSRNLVEEVLRQTRTISHLLHPPLLDELGLVSALKWYLDAFSTRSKIAVTLKALEGFPRLDNDSETAIFRVIQECLTNIHRHSGSEVASVELRHGPQAVEVTVRDSGTGIPVDKISNPDALVGVGLGGMRQRISQLGGTLEVHSDSSGTVVTATLPVSTAPRTRNIPDPMAAAG